MPLPDYTKVEFGTAIVWGEAGASGVTKTLSFDALADGSGIMGAKADLGAQWDQLQVVFFYLETGTAPTAGSRADLYMACSFDDSIWPGGVTGSAGAWPSDGNEDEWAKQLEYITSLTATNDGSVLQAASPVFWMPKSRYFLPVVDNNLGQAVRDEGTATNNDSRVIVVPYRQLIQDAA